MRKRQRRLDGIDEVYGAKVSTATISRITDKVLEMAEWQNRPLDAIHIKVRDGEVINRCFYVVVGGDRGRAPRHPRDG